MKTVSTAVVLAAAAVSLTGCATESSRSLEVEKVASYNTQYHGVRTPISVGTFDNRSSFQKGIFSDGEDRLGSQAKTILVTHLQQTNRFNVLNRTNLNALKQESGISGKAHNLKGADYVVTGDVTEFDCCFPVRETKRARSASLKKRKGCFPNRAYLWTS